MRHACKFDKSQHENGSYFDLCQYYLIRIMYNITQYPTLGT